MDNWQITLGALRTTSQILTAGIAIMAFSLLLYALAFNLRDRVARAFAMIMIFIVICFSADAIGSLATNNQSIEMWIRIQWVGIVFIPATYLHFSDALLSTTGKPSRGIRHLAMYLGYVVSLLFAISLSIPSYFGTLVMDELPAPHLRPTSFTEILVAYFIAMVVVAAGNYYSAYRRTTTTTSRRRMRYLAIGGFAPLLGSFPFLLFGSDFASRHTLIFWSLAIIANILVGVLLIVMAYAVAFFGVPWPDRTVKSRLFKWIMRGPVTASAALAVTTIVRRAGEVFGMSYTFLVPITMVGTILLFEYLITLFSRAAEDLLFLGNDRQEIQSLRRLEEHLLTHNDLSQFLEMILAAVCDRLQAPGAYIAALNPDGLQMVIESGEKRLAALDTQENLLQIASENGDMPKLFRWGDDYLVPLREEDEEESLIGLLGIVGVQTELDQEQLRALELLSQRTALALRDRQVQQQIFQMLGDLSSQTDLIERIRAAGRYDGSTLLNTEVPVPAQDMIHWVKEALNHYWGGPKLTESPLMQLLVVAETARDYEGNYSNALRAILKKAIEQIRPGGERRFTGEWILYNILEMKFLEGKKVREVALRLAMSEADLYRKQRVAIEAVAKAIMEMETEAHNPNNK